MKSEWNELGGFIGAFKAGEPKATWIAQQLPLIPLTPILLWLAYRDGRIVALLAVHSVGFIAFQITWIRHLALQRLPSPLLLKVIYSTSVFASALVLPQTVLPTLVVAAMGVAVSARSNDRASVVFYCVFVAGVLILLAGSDQSLVILEPWTFAAFLFPYVLMVIAFDSTLSGWEEHELESALLASGRIAWDTDGTGTVLKVMGPPLAGITPGVKISSLIHPDDHRPDTALPGSVFEYRMPTDSGWRWLRESVRVHGISSGTLRSDVTDISDARQATAQTEYLARTDHLTGCPNRIAHHEFVDHWAAERKKGHLLLIDFDGFKNINETLGHAVGDQVLTVISRRFAGIDLIAQLARLGGDEFGAVVAGSTAQAEEAAQKILTAAHGSITIDDLLVSTGVSIGIAALEADANADEMYRRASVALRIAKAGRGQAIMFDASLEARDERHLALASRLPSALAAGEFVVFHQPKVELATGRYIGTEALVRWRHPDEGLVMPGEFLDLVKVGGHYRALTRTVLQSALSDLARMHKSQPDLTVAVNINSRNLREFDFAEEVLAMLKGANIAPHHLVLELTEDALATGDNAVLKSLNELDDAGIRLSVDDFGTGFSSLSYLARLPVSEIKLDRSLVAEVRTSPRDRVVVESMLALAYDLDLQVIAEGIEDEETLELLDSLGCWSGQGYHISRPVPLHELTADWREPVPTA